LGCDPTFFKEWIESQFDDKMTWDNHGEYWQLDHVKPCKSFNMVNIDEQKKCFSWKNLRPLESKTNISKSDIIDEQLIKDFEEKVKQYCIQKNVVV
jgi:hypothetical protein